MAKHTETKGHSITVPVLETERHNTTVLEIEGHSTSQMSEKQFTHEA